MNLYLDGLKLLFLAGIFKIGILGLILISTLDPLLLNIQCNFHKSNRNVTTLRFKLFRSKGICQTSL